MKVSFKEAMEDAKEFAISPGCETENIGFYANARVDRNTLPKGWYLYEFRENHNGNICTIEPNVAVNFGGTFLTQKELIMTHTDSYRYLSGRGGYSFL